MHNLKGGKCRLLRSAHLFPDGYETTISRSSSIPTTAPAWPRHSCIPSVHPPWPCCRCCTISRSRSTLTWSPTWCFPGKALSKHTLLNGLRLNLIYVKKKKVLKVTFLCGTDLAPKGNLQRERVTVIHIITITTTPAFLQDLGALEQVKRGCDLSYL